MGYADISLGTGEGVQETYQTSDLERCSTLPIDGIRIGGGFDACSISSATLHQGTFDIIYHQCRVC